MLTNEKKSVTSGVKPHTPRNYRLPGGVMRYSQSRMYHKRGLFAMKKQTETKKEKPKKKRTTIVKAIGGEKNGGKRIVKLKKEKRFYPTEDKPKVKKTRKMVPFKKHVRHLRSRLIPGTICILLAGRHRGKRVVFLKQLESGLLLVTGPFQANGCPLRRINQIYVIATSTQIDMSNVKVPPTVNDNYFRRKKADNKKSKKDEIEIFETKKEGYVLTDQRKQDQIEVDRQVLDAVKAHPDKKSLYQYLKCMFSLQNKMYPHKLRF